MRVYPRSIRWRVQIWYALLLGLIVGALLVAFYQNQREIKYQALDRELTNPIPRLLPRLERGRDTPPRGRRPPGPGPGAGLGPLAEFETPRERREDRMDGLDELVGELAKNDIYLIQWDRRGNVRFSSDHAPEEGRPLPEEPIKPDEGNLKRTLDGYREIIHTTPAGGVLMVGKSIVPLEAELSALVMSLTGIGILIVGGGFLVGWLLIGRSLRMIGRISDAAHRIADGDLSERIQTKDGVSELGQLATVLNDTFERLERSFEHQVRFTADASHEMRTPIAVILAKSQFALSRERSPEKYQECLQTCIESAQHMRSLTDSLLDLAKVDSGEFHLETSEDSPARLVREVMAMIEPLAREKEVTLHSDLTEGMAIIDRGKMKQALLNLLGNAVKYNREGGEVTVGVRFENNDLCLTVRDTGPGIAPDDLPHLFERFYRVDKARTRDGRRGGTGLGLAITKAIVEAHGGKITVESEAGVGTVFEVRLPNSLGSESK